MSKLFLIASNESANMAGAYRELSLLCAQIPQRAVDPHEIHKIDPRTDPVQFEALASSADATECMAAAMCPKLTEEYLERLSRDSAESVRRIVASTVGLPQDILRRLGEDASELVRGGVAGNRTTPESVRRWMADNDPAMGVRRRALATLQPPDPDRADLDW
jgi:hypothetical protein